MHRSSTWIGHDFAKVEKEDRNLYGAPVEGGVMLFYMAIENIPFEGWCLPDFYSTRDKLYRAFINHPSSAKGKGTNLDISAEVCDDGDIEAANAENEVIRQFLVDWYDRKLSKAAFLEKYGLTEG